MAKIVLATLLVTFFRGYYECRRRLTADMYSTDIVLHWFHKKCTMHLRELAVPDWSSHSPSLAAWSLSKASCLQFAGDEETGDTVSHSFALTSAHILATNDIHWRLRETSLQEASWRMEIKNAQISLNDVSGVTAIEYGGSSLLPWVLHWVVVMPSLGRQD